MAGLNLRGSLGVSGAMPPSASPSTIGGLAYGADVAGAASNGGRKVAGMGTMGVTIGATAVLVWLWWSLPR